MKKSPATSQKPQLIIARASGLHHSPRKMRFVADAIRKMNPEEAMNYLKALPHRAAKSLLKVYQQAVGNAKSNFKASPGDLKIEALMVEEGSRGPKKADVHSHGARFDRGIRRKRFSHIKLILAIGGQNGAKS